MHKEIEEVIDNTVGKEENKVTKGYCYACDSYGHYMRRCNKLSARMKKQIVSLEESVRAHVEKTMVSNPTIGNLHIYHKNIL